MVLYEMLALFVSSLVVVSALLLLPLQLNDL